MNSQEKVIAARSAFGNSEESIKVHNKIFDEPHKCQWAKTRKYQQNIIDGTFIGILATGLLTATLNSFLPPKQIFSVAIFLTISSGVLYGVLDFLRRRDYTALYRHERERERWETINYLEGEQKEMIELYTSKGLSREDASLVISILSKKTEFFVDVMMKEELELVPPEESSLNTSTIIHSFLLVFGYSISLISLFPYHPYFQNLTLNGETDMFFTFVVIIAILSFISGSARSLFQTIAPWYVSGLEATVVSLAIISSTSFFANIFFTGTL